VHSIVTKSALENVQDEMSPINHSVGCNYPHEKLLCLSKERNGIRIKKMFFYPMSDGIQPTGYKKPICKNDCFMERMIFIFIHFSRLVSQSENQVGKK
jgi:hypothetical protein